MIEQRNKIHTITVILAIKNSIFIDGISIITKKMILKIVSDDLENGFKNEIVIRKERGKSEEKTKILGKRRSKKMVSRGEMARTLI